MNEKMKKTIATLTFVMAFAIMSHAQVFIISEEGENPRTPEDEGFFIENPDHESYDDWYLPVGDGALLLAALGGAYLVGKRRKKKE